MVEGMLPVNMLLLRSNKESFDKEEILKGIVAMSELLPSFNVRKDVRATTDVGKLPDSEFVLKSRNCNDAKLLIEEGIEATNLLLARSSITNEDNAAKLDGIAPVNELDSSSREVTDINEPN